MDLSISCFLKIIFGEKVEGRREKREREKGSRKKDKRKHESAKRKRIGIHENLYVERKERRGRREKRKNL